MRKIILILAFTYITHLYSQSETNYEYEKISKIIAPPSEEAYKLGTYGTVPVGLINGTPNITIPLTSIGIDGIDIPYSLSYSSSGIKVDDLEGYVGLSWQLIGGGVITRTVRDMPDEDGDYHFPEFDIKTGINNGNYNSFAYLNHINASGIDSEPDIFSFQFLGRSGKFIFDAQQNIIQIDKSDLIIERKSAPGIGYYYEITDESGNIFEFKEVELSLALKTTQGAETYTRPSSWFISKIVIGKNKQEIIFTYDPMSYTPISMISSSLKYFKSLYFSPFGQGTFGQGTSGYNPYPHFLDQREVKTHLDSKILKEITVANKSKLTFSYSQKILNAPKTLENITLQDNYGKIIDNINFGYTLTANNRIFLNKVENTKKKQNYLFGYNSENSFPQRLDKGQDIYGYYNGITTNNNLVPNYYARLDSYSTGSMYHLMAERTPNVLFNKIGLLNKITYPTGGYSEISYEGVNEQNEALYNLVYFPESQYFNIGSMTYSLDSDLNITASPPITYQTSSSKTIYFQCVAERPLTGCDDPGVPENHLHGYLKIYKDNVQYGDHIIITNNKTVTSVDLESGTYEFRIENVYMPCVMATVEVGDQPLIPAHYESIPKSNVTTSIGSRVHSIINKDFNGTELNSVFYKYYNFLNYSPLEFRTYSASFYKIINTPFIQTSVIINSVDQNSFVSYSPTYLYGKVNVSYGGQNFEKGGETHIFNTVPNSESSFIHGFEGNEHKMHSYDAWIDQKESEILYFNHSLSPVKRINNFYGERSTKNKFYFGIIANESFEHNTGGIESNSTIHTCSGTNDPVELEMFPECNNQPAGTQVGNTYALYNVELLQYKIGSYNKFLQSQITTDYQDGNPVVTTTEYSYNNPNHYQLTSQKTIFPDFSEQETTYQYAREKSKTDMIAANIVGIPLETAVVKKKSNNDPYPKTISKIGIDYEKKTINGKEFILPSKSLSYDLSDPSSSTDEVKYTKYDDKGNLLEYVLKPTGVEPNLQGTFVTIIWGYNQTQPIAKIEGAEYSDVSGYITDIVNASNTDAAQAPNNDEAGLLTALQTFRNNLPNYQVTTYTYDPLIGVRSITPPSGITEFYKYDSAGRLQEIKDINGNILKEFKYNYKH